VERWCQFTEQDWRPKARNGVGWRRDAGRVTTFRQPLLHPCQKRFTLEYPLLAAVHVSFLESPLYLQLSLSIYISSPLMHVKSLSKRPVSRRKQAFTSDHGMAWLRRILSERRHCWPRGLTFGLFMLKSSGTARRGRTKKARTTVDCKEVQHLRISLSSRISKGRLRNPCTSNRYGAAVACAQQRSIQ
jgi:hypothetical protein